MEVKLDRSYPLEVDAGSAWSVLGDVPAVAACMPGAAITERIDDSHYKGTVKLKVGPASALFAGDIEVRALEPLQHRLQLFGKGADRGGSSASMELSARLIAGEVSGHSVLKGEATVIVNGKFAQFGGRMMAQVSDLLLAQFVENFRAEVLRRQAQNLAAAPLAGTDSDADGATGPAGATVAADAGATVGAAAGGSVAASAAVPPPRPASELNALSILWALVKDWCAGRLGRRA